MSKKEYPLDNIQSIGSYFYTLNGNVLHLPKLLQAVLSSDKNVLRNFRVSGVLVKELNELLDVIKKHKGRLLIEKDTGDYAFGWEDNSYLDVDFNVKNKAIGITGFFLNDTLTSLKELLSKDFVSKTKTNLIFSIIRTSSGFDIKNMGDGSSPLIKDNYHPDVIEDMEFVVSSFKKSPPNGRICILNGEPGTGKTHLVRAFLKELDCVFLIVPSNLIDSLDKPEFMPLLLNVKNEHDKPIIMVIEDGDVCLVPRKNDNISTIASLLNLSDGILGSIIDIKMIITTNAEIKHMDQAIMRPGRLCKNITVGPLPYEQANKVYQRIINSSNTLKYQKFYTLAELYNIANNIGVTQPSHSSPQPHKVIGFQSREVEYDITVNKKNNE